MINFWRIIKFAALDFWRNIWLSINTITIITLSLLSINFLIIVNILVNQAIVTVENRVDVSIYFKKDVSNEQVETLKSRIAQQMTLKSSEIISPEKALERFRERYQNDTEIITALNELDENPFSYSLIVQANQLSDYSLLTSILDEPVYSQLIEEKDFTDLSSHERAIARVNEISDRAKGIGWGVTLILVFNSLLVVFNTIRLNIYTHREEIAIMRLVGANNWTIRGPFVIESILYALLSAGVAFIVIYPTLQFIQPFLPRFLGQPDFNIINFYVVHWLTLVWWQIIGVMILTVVASSIAIRRYLKI